MLFGARLMPQQADAVDDVDRVTRTEGYPAVFRAAKHVTVEIIPSISHFHLVTEETVIRCIASWVQSGV